MYFRFVWTPRRSEGFMDDESRESAEEGDVMGVGRVESETGRPG